MEKDILWIEAQIDLIEQERFSVEKNYLDISSILKKGIANSINEETKVKARKIQAKLDDAMNFFYSKSSLIIKDLEGKKYHLINNPKSSLGSDVISKSKISAFNYQDFADDDISLSKKEVNFFANNSHDDSDIQEFENIDKPVSVKELAGQLEEIVDKKVKSNIKEELEYSKAKVLFYDDRINEIEQKLNAEINNLKINDDFFAQQSDDILSKIQKFENNSSQLRNQASLERADSHFLLSLNDLMSSTLLKLENIENSIKEQKLEKQSSLTLEMEKLNMISSMNKEMDDLKNMVKVLSNENTSYKQKLGSYSEVISKLKNTIANSNRFVEKTNQGFMLNAKKLNELEMFFANQAAQFTNLSHEKNDLIHSLEDKVSSLKGKLKNNEAEFIEFKDRLSKQFQFLENQYEQAIADQKKQLGLNQSTGRTSGQRLSDSFLNDDGPIAKDILSRQLFENDLFEEKLNDDELINDSYVNFLKAEDEENTPTDEVLADLKQEEQNEELILPADNLSQYEIHTVAADDDSDDAEGEEIDKETDEEKIARLNAIREKHYDALPLRAILDNIEMLNEKIITKQDLDSFKSDFISTEIDRVFDAINEIKGQSELEFIKIQNDLLETNQKINQAISSPDEDFIQLNLFEHDQPNKTLNSNEKNLSDSEKNKETTNINIFAALDQTSAADDKKSNNNKNNNIIRKIKEDVSSLPIEKYSKTIENINKLREMEKVLIELDNEFESLFQHA